MLSYLVRRLLMVIPTLFAIMVLNFVIIQAAPGGPVDRLIADLKGQAIGALDRVSGESRDFQTQAGNRNNESNSYRSSQGIDPELIRELEKQFGFDKPAHERFFLMMGNYLLFDFGESFFQDRTVIDLVLDKLPVSISLGLWTTLLTYFISIPLGIRKAVKDGTPFDVWSSSVIIIGYAIPGFLFAIFLIVVFAGGQYFSLFPLRGLVSDHWELLDWPARILDYFWHMALPILSMVIGGFATLTMLTKNSFLDEINKHYVVTARQKGLSDRQVLYAHVFRNAMLIVIAGFPGAFIGILFTGSLLIEVIFSLDGLGLLGFEATINRDYPLMFGTLYVFTLIGLLLHLVTDLSYMLVDPRIDFEKREG